MKTLIVNGSPHGERGVHNSLIGILEKGLKKARSDVETISLSKIKVNSCLGCFSCWTRSPGECVHKDDMSKMLPKVTKADILVLASPVYVDGVTGLMKNFMDRLIPLIKGGVELRNNHMRHVLRENVKRGKLVLLSASGFAELDNFYPLVVHLKAASKNLGRQYAGEILVPSGWFISYSNDALEEASNIISSAAAIMVNDGKVPSEVSEQLSALVSRDEVMNAMNSYYNQFE
ncbi:MAG: flavodoxin family protein [Candidatus Thorarchaeota archaeon]|nr:flavodoxin family protein [Candidatus Thorarchaeota archaeon]